MHAGTLAETFDMGEVLIPPRAGLLCALGLALAGIRQDAVISYPMNSGIDASTLGSLAGELAERLRGEMGSEPDGAPLGLGLRLAMRNASRVDSTGISHWQMTTSAVRMADSAARTTSGDSPSFAPGTMMMAFWPLYWSTAIGATPE